MFNFETASKDYCLVATLSRNCIYYDCSC